MGRDSTEAEPQQEAEQDQSMEPQDAVEDGLSGVREAQHADGDDRLGQIIPPQMDQSCREKGHTVVYLEEDHFARGPLYKATAEKAVASLFCDTPAVPLIYGHIPPRSKGHAAKGHVPS